MADDIEDLLRLQKGWKKPEPLPEPKFSVLFSQKRLFRDRAAQVLHEAHLGLASASMKFLRLKLWLIICGCWKLGLV